MERDFGNILRELLGERFSQEEEHLKLHSSDESFYSPVAPLGVCFPENEREIQEIVCICNKYVVPIFPYGAGTSIEGQVIPVKGGISLDLSRLNRIISVHPEDQDCTVEAGVRKKHLNKILEPHGLFFPAGPLVDASIGGMASTSASGINAVRFGTMKENVLSLRFVNPRGEIIITGRRARKSSAGYDLTHLLIGAEGTLGIITELTLRLQPIPPTIVNVFIVFRELDNAVLAVSDILRAHITPAAIELLDDVQIRAVNRYSSMNLQELPTLFLELHGFEGSLNHDLKIVKKIANNWDANHFDTAIDAGDRERLWKARADCYYANQQIDSRKSAFTTDVCVPLSNLVRCIRETKKDLADLGMEAPLVGHVGDGNFHLILLTDMGDPQSINDMRWIHNRLIKRAIELDGTCTGEHGIGMGKIDYLIEEKGEDTVQAMLGIKKAWDPNFIMNPGKIFKIPEKSASQ